MLMRCDEGHKLALVTASVRGLLHVPVCQMASVVGRLGFASERDLAAFAAWLGQAQPPPAGQSDSKANSSAKVHLPTGLRVYLAMLAI